MMEFFQNTRGHVIRSNSFTLAQLGELFGDTINSNADVIHSRRFELTWKNKLGKVLQLQGDHFCEDRFELTIDNIE